jgi:hypothetical protein
MAWKQLLYNVTDAVGNRCPNQTDDVLLVRFFLRRISQAPDVMGPYSDLPFTPAYDDQLGDAILWFQKKVAATHNPVSTDGRVDPAPHGGSLFYTIRHLNMTYRRRYPQFQHSIENDPQLPGALKMSFSSARSS